MESNAPLSIEAKTAPATTVCSFRLAFGERYSVAMTDGQVRMDELKNGEWVPVGVVEPSETVRPGMVLRTIDSEGAVKRYDIGPLWREQMKKTVDMRAYARDVQKYAEAAGLHNRQAEVEALRVIENHTRTNG
jgi:hypothetical protein